MSIFSVSEAKLSGWGKRSAKFSLWMGDLNKLVVLKTGLSIHDFPDWGFADSYEDGATPREACHDFISDMMEEGYL